MGGSEMKLTWQNVDTVVKEVLLDNETDRDVVAELHGLAEKNPKDVEAVKRRAEELGVVIASGVMQHMAFHKERLEARRADIRAMLDELSDDFLESVGGGMSLMQMPFTKDGTQWGEQWMADLLYTMGAALGECWYTVADRERWGMLPGGMPYITIKG